MQTKPGALMFRGLLLASALAASATVQAQSAPYGCACLHNSKVDASINYRFKWGDREWKQASLAKGKYQWMCWTYKDAPKSPELTFQLDVDMTGKSEWKTFSIPRGQSKEQNCSSGAKHYHVGYVADTNKKKIRIFDGK